MSYSPLTDFLGLLRRTNDGVRSASVPGTDYVVSALARLGLLNLAVNQTAPATNQAATAWFQPSVNPGVAEGTLYIWNGSTYVQATPDLWNVLINLNSSLNYVSIAALGTGAYAAQPADDVILLKSGIAAAFVVTVDWSLRLKPLTIVDSGLGALAHNISVSPVYGQTQMGTLNYTYIIDSNGGSIKLTPLPDGSGAY